MAPNDDQQLSFLLPAAPVLPAQEAAGKAARQFLDMGTIYLEPGVEAFPRGLKILARFPDAERRPVASR